MSEARVVAEGVKSVGYGMRKHGKLIGETQHSCVVNSGGIAHITVLVYKTKPVRSVTADDNTVIV